MALALLLGGKTTTFSAPHGAGRGGVELNRGISLYGCLVFPHLYVWKTPTLGGGRSASQTGTTPPDSLG